MPERQKDPLPAVEREAGKAAALQNEPGEIAGDQEEQHHAEHVRDIEKQGKLRGGCIVLHDPDRRAGNEGHRGVQHDAEQERDRSDGVERMEAG